MTREEKIQKAVKIFYASSDDYKKGFEAGVEWADQHPHKPTREEILKELRAHAEYIERLYTLMGQIPPIEQLAVLQMEEGRKQAIDKAVNWLSLNAESYGDFNPGKLNDLVVAFRKAMEE